MASQVASRIAERVLDKGRRLFAVVHLNGRQYKVGEGDIIQVGHNVPLKLNDRIRLEKVLAIGGTDFTLLGRPLLDKAQVRVDATVIEKTTTYPEPDYTHVAGKQIERLVWLSHELTVLRINSIGVDASYLEPTGASS